MPYFFEEQQILKLAKSQEGLNSICSFCARMKRGRLYAAMRREGYNVLALGQHLDDVVESFVMAMFFNGVMRTIKAHYTVAQEDLRVIRPFTFCRERDLRAFAAKFRMPVIDENCPACFEAPKERVRCKQLLAAQEHQNPQLFKNMKSALMPCLSVDNAKPDEQDVWTKAEPEGTSEGRAGQPPKATSKGKTRKKKGGPKVGVRWARGDDQPGGTPHADITPKVAALPTATRWGFVGLWLRQLLRIYGRAKDLIDRKVTRVVFWRVVLLAVGVMLGRLWPRRVPLAR